MKAFTDIHYSIETPPMEDNSGTYQFPAEKANLITDVYEACFNVNHDGRAHCIDEHKVQLAIENNDSDLNELFTLHELKLCFKGLKKTSNGQDVVHNLMIKNLPVTYSQ